jgi:hypothetical protein
MSIVRRDGLVISTQISQWLVQRNSVIDASGMSSGDLTINVTANFSINVTANFSINLTVIPAKAGIQDCICASRACRTQNRNDRSESITYSDGRQYKPSSA